MIKRVLFAFLIVLAGSSCYAQSNVLVNLGVPYANGSLVTELLPPQNGFVTITHTFLDPNGQVTLLTLIPGKTYGVWATKQDGTVMLYGRVTVTGAAQDITSALIGVGGGGGGSVLSFSAGNLPPLFTTSVANATTNPVLTFILSTQPANCVFGNFTGVSATPGCTAAPTFSAVNLTNFPTLNQNTTGTAANLSGTPALPNGTTATTQTVGDNSTKIATDAFVLANSGGTPAWSVLTNPAGNLLLSMGSNTSTFDTTSALSPFFAWKNITAAVVGTSQGSPINAICGRAFHASADTEDCMTFSELPGNGNDAAIVFNIGHTGSSTGVVTTNFPGPVAIPQAGGVGGMVSSTEGTAPAALGTASQDNCYADSTAHQVLCKDNNGTTRTDTRSPTSTTSGNVPIYADTQGNLATGKGVQGTDANFLTSGTVTGSNVLLKTDASGGATTSSITDNGTTVSTTETLSLGSSPPACTAGTAGAVCFTEGTTFTNVASTAGIYPDSTQHEFFAGTAGAAPTGMLVRRQPGAIHQTAQTAAISTATLCAASAGACNVAGQYHIHFTFIETGTACATPGTGGVTFLLTWTDTNATTHSAVSLGFDDASAINAVSQTFHFQTTLAAAWGSGDFNVSTNGSVIQYATGYTACGVGTGTYQLDAVVTRLQ